MYLKNKYNCLFVGFLASILIVFFYFRPLNSPWFKFIAGDGLGYYSYLPAKYIYHDSNYDFKWFNKVYNSNYEYCSFNSPDDNFMVQYKDKRINKYYPGLSLLWLPFFALAHVSALIFGFAADGYSLPYQLCIALASLCYLFLGLFYLRKLLLKLFHNELVSTIIPIVMFYGSYLFYYSLFLNSQSHVYSFAFISVFLYFSHSFFNSSDKKNTYLLLSLLSLLILVSIRPLNGLILLAVPALMPSGFFKEKWFYLFQKSHLIIAAFILLFIINTFHILYVQTGSLIPYTYVNERFYFDHPKLIDVLFSYHAGLFVYVPLAFVSLFGLFYLQNNRQKILFPAVFFLVVYLYSAWWYWPITTRALIDFYPLLAILLAALLNKVIQQQKFKTVFIVLLFVLTGYHQLKSMQLHNGILDENYTHSELFWRNFFKIHKSNIYVIPPSAIVKQATFTESMENNTYNGYRTQNLVHEGSQAALLDKDHAFSSIFEYKIPAFYHEKGVKKIRFSFWCYFKEDITSAQIYLKFFDKENNIVMETPFYLNTDYIQYHTWDYKEFGYELSDEELNSKALDHIQLFIWNNETKSEIYIDDVKTEFILTDKSYEIVQ